jgi:hypothetical protein
MFNYQLLITLELSPKSLGELPICPFTLLPIHPSYLLIKHLIKHFFGHFMLAFVHFVHLYG